MEDVNYDMLRAVIGQEPSFFLEPRSFLVTWYGVIRLSYEPFPPPVHRIKRRLETEIPDLRKENAGSKWPGTTLGALKDKETLSFDDLVLLKRTCETWQPVLQEENIRIPVYAISFVRSACRNLERRSNTWMFALDETAESTGEIPVKHRNRVEAVHREFDADRLQQYYPLVARTGHRESHYRQPMVEDTLVIDVPRDELPDCISGFVHNVETQLPDKYAWFSRDSLHVTLRSMEKKKLRKPG